MARLGLGFGNKGVGGGSLDVVRAVALTGQTVRVVFNQAPVARSPIGSFDAFNVGNYRFGIVAPGTGAVPTAVGVSPTIVQGPAYGPVQAGQWAADVRVDRPLVQPLTYLVDVQGIVAASGDILGSFTSATFPGAVPLHHTAAVPRPLSNIDLATNILTGGYGFSSAGDIANHGGADGLRKRVIRRLTTPQGAFRDKPTYGAAIPLKKPFSPSNLQAYKTRALQQVKLEPEVASAAIVVTLQTLAQASVVTTDARIKTKTGLVLAVQTQQTADGRFMIASTG